MIHLNTKRNEDVYEVDDWFEPTLIKEKWRCKWSRNEPTCEDVDEVDDSFEHTLIKEKWRCKWSRWFIWTHIYQREMKM